jgi:hypothetical protein
MAFPAIQTVHAFGVYGLEIVGPAGSSVAIMFDALPQNLAVPPYGAIGVGFPPVVTFDGIGLGLPGSIATPLSIGPSGALFFSYAPVPASLVGATLYAQAVAVHPSFPLGAMLSTQGDLTLPTPACQVTIVP